MKNEFAWDFLMDQPAPQQPDIRPSSAHQYSQYWLPVHVSEMAAKKMADLEVLHFAFRRAVQAAIANIQEGYRLRPQEFASRRVHVVEFVPMEDVPEGIKMSFHVNADGIWVADLYTKLQHSLFHVARE